MLFQVLVIHSFLLLNSISLYQMYYVWFIYSSIDGRLSCILDIMSKVTINICVQIFVGT